ncbi:LEAF RUST 10 DISEASE-RESISTANCE LOCUS RECEPTOR-LIKE PROTEIN KINASE-like 2.3 [Hevea brasiliensis]|uniref:LEAF RUST 10 DISEASE-RESISTANCE LOCUS RECEPTOR-LIKE PROTEIN KINASE-like 2.3 n=1 Tax=Hevea brasiliensis TaxID=3981 RepID=UPI0025FA90EF|nr:LEAF RUST 10 DISEASE-RESISTANCE LOCUS RECEPTOR-LIKE PROTEIN KINASE-like 2.3 [Hevea brasiliensis]
MIRERLQIFVLLLITQIICNATDTNHCPPSSCGNIHNISKPFRLQTDPNHCGKHGYELSCENNITVLNLFRGRYYVQAINYDDFTIRLVDDGINPDDCSSIPRFPLTRSKLSEVDDRYWSVYSQPMISFIKCPNPVYSPSYLDCSTCINGGSALQTHTYAMMINENTEVSDLMELCSVEMIYLLPDEKAFENRDNDNIACVEIHRQLAYGFELMWELNYFDFYQDTNDTTNHFGIQDLPYTLMEGIYAIVYAIELIFSTFSAVDYPLIFAVIGKFLVGRALFGLPFVIAFLVFKWRRKHRSEYDTIEEFLQTHNNLMPIRYSYSHIKKITRGLKEKLGEGGFGSVYKGKLRSGQFAAVKILDKSKADGQDFINEVATIGKIHHVNVVKLIGFCAEGSRRALIYEFMSKGSLNNYITCHEGSISLSWEKLYEISLGVARGIEYLHRGCDMQILHFDIKPHNILLDENFTPKISDFGIAKFYPTKGSIPSLTAAGGTVGYMAPEIFYRNKFYKNIERVSYKADVYSFGQLVLEMADREKKVNAFVESLSDVYSPYRLHDQLSSGNLPIEDIEKEENIKARKMMITGLWCVQFQPSNRPAMNKVIEMLEGDFESLQMPPRPVLFPADSMITDGGRLSLTSDEFTESNSLAENSGGHIGNILLSAGEGQHATR